MPFNYQHMIQGLIYSAFDKEDKGDFFHNQGYRFEKKVFKMFVFSNLFGKYKINDRFMVFEDSITFYVSSYSEDFLKEIYDFYMENEKVILNGYVTTNS